MAIENLRRYESPSTEHKRAGGEILRPEIRTLINCTCNKEELPDSGRSQSLYLVMQLYGELYIVTEISLLPSILQLNFFCISTACFQIGQYFVATEGVMTDKSSTKYTVEIVYNVMKGTGYFVSFEAIIWRIEHCNRNKKKRKIEMAGTCGEDE